MSVDKPDLPWPINGLACRQACGWHPSGNAPGKGTKRRCRFFLWTTCRLFQNCPHGCPLGPTRSGSDPSEALHQQRPMEKTAVPACRGAGRRAVRHGCGPGKVDEGMCMAPFKGWKAGARHGRPPRPVHQQRDATRFSGESPLRPTTRGSRGAPSVALCSPAFKSAPAHQSRCFMACTATRPGSEVVP